MKDWQLPLATFVLGQIFAIALNWLQARWQRGREREAREEERAQRSVDLQRETLVQLQEALAEHSKAVLGTHLRSSRKAEASGSWSRNTLDADALDEEQEAERRVQHLIERIKDDELRALWGPVSNHLMPFFLVRSRKDSDLLWLDWLEKSSKLMQRFGVVLREHV